MPTEIDDEIYDFGLRIKSLRQQMHWTQEQLGRKIGVNKDTISNYENNIKAPSLIRLKNLARVFHVSIDYLLGMDNTPTIKTYDMSENEKRVLQEFITTFIDKNTD